MREEYNNINTPKKLFEFMNQNISYGYLGKNNKIYYFGLYRIIMKLKYFFI